MGMTSSGARERARAWLAVASPWITLVSDLCIFASFVAFYALEIQSIDRGRFAKMIPQPKWLTFRYARTKGVRMSSSSSMGYVITCSPLLFGAVLVTLTRRLPKGPPQRAVRWFRVRARRLLYRQLPPRGFFAWWCGGMSVLDATLIVLYVFANAYWVFFRVSSTHYGTVLPMKRVGLLYDHPFFLNYAESFAVECGLALHWSLWLLYLPLPHSSFLQTLTGIDYAGMIRYHRWLGHGTMVLTSLHCLPYYYSWVQKGTFNADFWNWGTTHARNMLAGSIAWIGGMLLWVTSSDWVRRRSFELFYGMHLFGFVLYTVFGCIHWMGTYSMFLPGALLWMIDLVFRSAALANVTAPVACEVNASENTADVTLLHSRRGSCPVSHVYFLVPKLSRFQWHPFSVRSQDAEGRLRISVKDSGSYTREVVRRLARRERLDMRIIAAPHRMAPLWENHDSVVIFGGGVGVTGAWAVLSEMAHERARRRAAGEPTADLPAHVHVIWAARSHDEFFTMESWVADALEDPDRWLRLTLHCTRKEPGLAPGALGGRALGGEIEIAAAQPDDGSAPRRETAVEMSSAIAGSRASSSSPSRLKDVFPPSQPGATAGNGNGNSNGNGNGNGNGKVAWTLTDDSSSETERLVLPGSLGENVSVLASGFPSPPSSREAPLFAKWSESPYLFNALRRVQPGGGGDFVWILAHVLVFFGAFTCLLAVQAYTIEQTSYMMHNGFRPRSRPFFPMYWKAGLLQMFAVIVGGIGFPTLVLIAPLHLFRYWKDRYLDRDEELIAPSAQPLERSCAVGPTSVRVGSSDVVLPIHPGRPDIRSALSEASGPIVGVYASGPESMNNDLLVAAHDANKTMQSTYFDYRKLATML